MTVSCSRGRKFVMCAVYRPPRHATNHLAADFNCLDIQLQRILLTTSDPILLTGDFNCNLLGRDSDPAKAKLLEFIDCFNFHQFVRSPTFRTGSLLDVFISNVDTFVRSVDVLPCSYSGHHLVKACITIPKLRPKPCVIESRRLNHLNIVDFSASLLHTDWSPVFSCGCVADQWTAFLQLFLPILDFHAPVKRLKGTNPALKKPSNIPEIYAKMFGRFHWSRL